MNKKKLLLILTLFVKFNISYAAEGENEKPSLPFSQEVKNFKWNKNRKITGLIRRKKIKKLQKHSTAIGKNIGKNKDDGFQYSEYSDEKSTSEDSDEENISKDLDEENISKDLDEENISEDSVEHNISEDSVEHNISEDSVERNIVEHLVEQKILKN